MRHHRIDRSFMIVADNENEVTRILDFINPLPPATGLSVVTTFHSAGIYYKPMMVPSVHGLRISYRKKGDSMWIQGHPLWFDARVKEARGSIVYLDSGTTYEVIVMLDAVILAATQFTTWTEKPLEGEKVTVGSRNRSLDIIRGGVPGEYMVYTSGMIDVLNAEEACIRVNASHVILRGLTLRGSKRHLIVLGSGVKDVIIERSDFSEWGTRNDSMSTKAGFDVGRYGDSAIHADDGTRVERIVIQYNNIHDPRYGSNSWSDGHPQGPNGVRLVNSNGNNVIRWNDVGSDRQLPIGRRYFMDALGAETNFSEGGFPGRDSDIYGNNIYGTADDAIEAEGGGMNVRIWGNLMDMVGVPVGLSVVHHGPTYVFRNVSDRNRFLFKMHPDQDKRAYFAKTGNVNYAGKLYGQGKMYLYHNTMLQRPPVDAGVSLTLGAGIGIGATGSDRQLTHCTSRNNVWHIWKDHWNAIDPMGGTEQNDFNNDLYSGRVSAAQTKGINGKPIYKTGHGPGAVGKYQLASISPGFDKGEVIPNFNDGFTGAAPDVGAHEDGTPDLKFGRNGSGKGAGANT